MVTIMIVAPVPVSLLVFLIQILEFAVWIHVVLDRPLLVVDNLIMVPAMVVVIIGVVILVCAAGSCQARQNHSAKIAGGQVRQQRSA